MPDTRGWAGGRRGLIRSPHHPFIPRCAHAFLRDTSTTVFQYFHSPPDPCHRMVKLLPHDHLSLFVRVSPNGASLHGACRITEPAPELSRPDCIIFPNRAIFAYTNLCHSQRRAVMQYISLTSLVLTATIRNADNRDRASSTIDDFSPCHTFPFKNSPHE